MKNYAKPVKFMNIIDELEILKREYSPSDYHFRITRESNRLKENEYYITIYKKFEDESLEEYFEILDEEEICPINEKLEILKKRVNASEEDLYFGDLICRRQDEEEALYEIEMTLSETIDELKEERKNIVTEIYAEGSFVGVRAYENNIDAESSEAFFKYYNMKCDENIEEEERLTAEDLKDLILSDEPLLL